MIAWLQRSIEENNFKVLLVTLLLLILVSPHFLESYLGGWLLTAIITVIMISIVFTLVDNKSYVLLGIILALIILSSHIYTLYFDSLWLQVLENIASLIFYCLALEIIFTEMFQGRKITTNTIYAALCFYLLMAVAFSNAYGLVELLSPGSFVITHQMCITACNIDALNLIYFSFVALTTVGFGDIVPISPYAKSIVILEGISWVLYLAVLVSRLVSGLTLTK